MTHDEIKDALPALALEALDPVEREVVTLHVRTCAECQAELQALLKAMDGIGLEAAPVTPPASLRSKVIAAATAQPPAASTDARVLPWRQAPAPERSGRAAWPWIVALAASLALAVGAIGYALYLRGQISDLQMTARLLQAPDLVRATLKGAASAEQASGVALWSRSAGLLFSASNLPALPAGKVYQLWTITGTNAASAGLLAPDAHGSVRFAQSVAAGAPKPDAFGVTIESAGGSATPTLPIVLVGSAGQ